MKKIFPSSVFLITFVAYHQYSPVAFSVNAPQLDIGLGPNCRGTRGPIDQSQLPKTASLTNAGHPFTVNINLDGDREE